MKLYLDMCCLKRPFDDQSDPRIATETIAVTAVLDTCRIGVHDLVGSEFLWLENARDTKEDRKAHVEVVFHLMATEIEWSEAIEQRAMVWQNVGVKVFDSYHLAVAEAADVDVFSTCDDGLLKRAGRLKSSIRILNITDLFRELMPWE